MSLVAHRSAAAIASVPAAANARLAAPPLEGLAVTLLPVKVLPVTVLPALLVFVAAAVGLTSLESMGAMPGPIPGAMLGAIPGNSAATGAAPVGPPRERVVEPAAAGMALSGTDAGAACEGCGDVASTAVFWATKFLGFAGAMTC
jgi:hypothetical protein